MCVCVCVCVTCPAHSLIHSTDIYQDWSWPPCRLCRMYRRMRTESPPPPATWLPDVALLVAELGCSVRL